MSVELLIARPASGKTQTCIQRVRAMPPLAETWVLLPDRLQAAAFRRRLAQAGGAIGAHVGTFGDLYRAILERADRDVPLASAPLLHYVLQDVVDVLAAKDKLAHYAPLRGLPGFYLALRDSFAELKRALVYPDQFTKFTETGSPARQELALLYAAYQARLQELGWADADGLSWLAVEALENHPQIAQSIQLLVVDGFDSFNGAQRRALKLLSEQVQHLLITFPGEPGSNRPAHRRFAGLLEKLTGELKPEIADLPGQPFLPPDALHLEANLFESDELQAQTPGQAFLLETRSPADEAREALRWIKAQVVREGLPLSECAVFTPNPDIYNSFLRSVAAEFGIPVHFTQSIPLKDSPAIAALLNLLGLPAENFRSRLLFNTLRSPYFELGLDTGSVDALEEISRVARIAEGWQAWQATWERLIPSEYTDQADLDEERSLPGLPRGEQAKGLRQAINAVFELIVIPEQPQSQTAWVAWLEDLLERLNYYQNTGLERDQAACETLRETLRALVLSESVLGARSIDYTGFLTGLQNTLNGVGLPEARLKDGAALLVGNIVEARGLRFQAVALLGFCEGLFPQVERPDPFLDEALRQSLAMDARLNREQAGLFYQAVTRADHSLLLTRPYLSDDGEAWEASPYWKDAAKRFTPDACRRIRPEDAHSLFDAASSQEVLFRIALNCQAGPVESLPKGRMPEAFAELAGRWDAIWQGGGVLSARRGRKPQGDYEGYTPHLQPELAARYAPEQVWSASRLEAYGNCPHQFFIKNALGLEARVLPEPGMEVTQLGSLLHEILELVYQQAADPGDLASVLAALPEVAAQAFEGAPEKYGFSPSAAWDFEQANFLSILSETIIALHKASQGWTPSAYEAKFGIQGQPVLEIDLGEETLRLRGVIDRLDKNERGEIRVMDYKTGGSHLSGDDLLRGTRLQLPIYALAARDALGLGDVSEGFYWEIKGAKAGSLKLSKFKTRQSEGVDEAIRVAVEHLRRIVSGIRSGEFPPVPPKGGCPSYCPAAQWCWHYQPGFGGGK